MVGYITEYRVYGEKRQVEIFKRIINQIHRNINDFNIIEVDVNGLPIGKNELQTNKLPWMNLKEIME